MIAFSILLVLAGLTGVVYGAGINLQGMLARRATDYSSITAYITEWSLILIAGLLLLVAAVRRK